MSAICGVIGMDGRPWTVTDLDGMCRALAPLGRDGVDRWSGVAGSCGVAVGAALRHSTPEDAGDRQPAQNAGGWLVFAGDVRVDNRDDLAGQLPVGNDGATPDSAFVVAAYERWGETFLDRLVGEFALAIVDRRRGGVLIARDQVGARPLCVHERPGILAFASMPLALACFEGVGRRLDVEHAAEILALGYWSERTFVEGVRWFPAGSVMWVDDRSARPRRWWTPDPTDIDEHGKPETYERALRDAFDAAVAARLRTVGRAGAAVSGGLDSASAAATAARLLAPASLPTYTAAPPPGWEGGERPGWDADESPLVRALAHRHPNIVPTFVHVTPGTNVLDLQEPLWELGAGPVRNPANALWSFELRERAAADGVTALLSGDHGNLFFSADAPGWLVAHLRAGRLPTAVKEAAAWRTSTGESWYRILRNEIAVHVIPSSVLDKARKLVRRPTPLEQWMSATALRPEIASSLDLATSLPHLDKRHGTHPRLLLLTTLGLSATQADVWAAIAATTGVESRDPTADRRVLEVAMRQPDTARRRAGVSRAVARGAMSDRLPPEIVDRTRRGEQLPDWLDVMTTTRAVFVEEVDRAAQHPTSRDLIDVESLRRLVAQWPERHSRADPMVAQRYRSALLRALVVSRYLRWFEAGA